MPGGNEQAIIGAVDAEEDAPEPTIEPDQAVVLTLSDLVGRLGPASGAELFERIDSQFRRGNHVFGTTVRAARESFGAARVPGHARLVVKGRPGRGRDVSEAVEGMVMIALEDLEAVVKANQTEFDWLAEFAPRRDLPTATTPLIVRSGVSARRMLRA